MDKYISETDLKKYLDKQLKEAIRLKDLDVTNSYFCGRIDEIEELAEKFGLTLDI